MPNEEVNPYHEARNIYLTRNIENGPTPDLESLAEELGLEEEQLRALCINGEWSRHRMLAVRAFREKADVAVAEMVNVLVDDVVALRKKLFVDRVKLIQAKWAAVVEYLDNLMADDKLSAKDAISYLKLLADLSTKTQLDIDAHIKTGEDTDKDAEEFLENIIAKQADVVKILQGSPAKAIVLPERSRVFEALDDE